MDLAEQVARREAALVEANLRAEGWLRIITQAFLREENELEETLVQDLLHDIYLKGWNEGYSDGTPRG